jgi:transposase
MDNARVHCPRELGPICTQDGCSVKFLSPYSYMLNPVENIFSKVKNYVRNCLSRESAIFELPELIRQGVEVYREMIY